MALYWRRLELSFANESQVPTLKRDQGSLDLSPKNSKAGGRWVRLAAVFVVMFAAVWLGLPKGALADTVQTAVPASSLLQVNEGAYIASSDLVVQVGSSEDVMSLIVKHDPARPGLGYLFMAEYDRLVTGSLAQLISRRIPITKWTNRMFLFQMEQSSANVILLRRLVVQGGVIEAEENLAGLITLQQAGQLQGATLRRFKAGTSEVAEVISVRKEGGSTWEPFVPGHYFGLNKFALTAYFKKSDINTFVSPAGVISFSRSNMAGAFQMNESRPRMFTFSPISMSQAGEGALSPISNAVVAETRKTLTKKIGVFIDIMNWKPLMNTNELLIVNPEDPSDIDFYYERPGHEPSVAANQMSTEGHWGSQ